MVRVNSRLISISLFCFFCLLTAVQSTESSCDYSTFCRLDNFDISKFLGVWHEIKYVLSFSEEPGSEWTDFELHFEEDENGKIKNNIRARNGSGICVYISDEMKPKEFGWTQTIGDNPNDRDWNVYDTDYVNYAFLYGCYNGNTTTCEDGRIWIISRTNSLSKQLLDEAQKMAETVCMVPLKTAKFVESCPAGKVYIIPNIEGRITIICLQKSVIILSTICVIYGASFTRSFVWDKYRAIQVQRAIIGSNHECKGTLYNYWLEPSPSEGCRIKSLTMVVYLTAVYSLAYLIY